MVVRLREGERFSVEFVLYDCSEMCGESRSRGTDSLNRFCVICVQVCDEPKPCEIDSTRLKEGENLQDNLVRQLCLIGLAPAFNIVSAMCDYWSVCVNATDSGSCDNCGCWCE